MNTPLEFDEKKFWIALFSIMAQRGAANAKRNHRVFVPFISSYGERTIPNGFPTQANPKASKSFFEL
jgi:hypothetical protein